MRKIAIIIIIALIACGCCPCRKLSQSSTERDSVRIAVQTTVIERIDTVETTLPVEVYVNRTSDTSSVLETSAAVSTASIAGGILVHTIRSKKSIAIPVVERETIRDSIVYRDRLVRKTVTVERNYLTKWQRFQKNGFWVLLSAVFVFAFFYVFLKKLQK